ncbi:MAG: BREX-1 system adenine-specific DNA-methyltransferase PglX, partial [Proteobacteria bacterium]
TWFNRFMALRFMDVNDYQPFGIRVLTPKDGYTLPELLDEAKQGHIPEELSVDKQRIFDLIDGKIPSSNGQNEAYKELLIGACNHLNHVLPFLFERINDYTELLLPDDLTSELSIVQDIRDGMTIEDCAQVEIIGWLYQFYISQKKDEVFASKLAVKKEDIPAATQLFTPRWIVEYMVQNTVGKLWLQNKPSSKLREYMPYFIESPSVTAEEYLKINSVEEITLLDQACGSGHILVYGFELLYKIYEEEGYNPNEIPELIITKNLYGFEIDERASQLAAMALMMKARSYQRRFFKKEVEPNILCYKDLTLTTEEVNAAFGQIGHTLTDELNYDLTQMQQATNYGSLVSPHSATAGLKKTLEVVVSKENTTDAFLKYQLGELRVAIEQLLPLSRKYHCIVDNPPYMGGGNMNKALGDFVKVNYPDSKA